MNSNIIKNIEIAYDRVNEEIFLSTLPKAFLSIDYNLKPPGKNGLVTMGWFSRDIIWKNHDDETYVPLTITSDGLCRDYFDVMATLVHEMIHIYCAKHNIEEMDGRKHNEEFKSVAETFGLIVEKHKSTGYGQTHLSEKLRLFFDDLDIDKSIFDATCTISYPEKAQKEKKPKYKHYCPACGKNFTLKKNFSLTCTDCNVNLNVETIE